MNPDQRESLERKNPHRYGGLGLVSIYVHECQTLLFCVNLYCSKPFVSLVLSFTDAKPRPGTAFLPKPATLAGRRAEGQRLFRCTSESPYFMQSRRDSGLTSQISLPSLLSFKKYSTRPSASTILVRETTTSPGPLLIVPK